MANCTTVAAGKCQCKVLLTPHSYGDSNTNRKEDICIKEALFEFLSCVQRRI